MKKLLPLIPLIIMMTFNIFASLYTQNLISFLISVIMVLFFYFFYKKQTNL